MGLFGFNLFRAFCISYILISVSFRFGKFSAIISSNIFSISFSFSSPSGISTMHRLAYFILSHRSHIAFMFFQLVFCLLSDCVISIILSSTSLIHSYALSILLFSAFNLVCISAHEFSNFYWFLLICSSFFLFLSFSFSFVFLGPHSWHMEVPRLEVKSEL